MRFYALFVALALFTVGCTRKTQQSASNSVLARSDFALFDPLSPTPGFSRQQDVQVKTQNLGKPARVCLSETDSSRAPEASSPCWNASVPGLFALSAGDGQKTVYLWTATQDGIVGTQPLVAKVTLDTAPPTLTFLQAIPAVTSATVVNFTPRGSDALSGVLSVECAVDAGTSADCSQGMALSALSEGAHGVAIRVRDHAGNSLDGNFPILIDRTNPTAQLNATPATPTNQVSASFVFSGNDGAGSGVTGFECKLDGGVFTACTSPQPYTALAAGLHTFTLRSKDGAGNTSNLAAFNWMVDLTAPGVTLGTGPAAASNSTSASFTFTGTGVATFTCRLDGGTVEACTSPKSYAGLAQGNHTFSLTGTSAAGNTTTVSSTWVVDSIAPALTLDQGAVNPSASSRATFQFTATDGGGTGLSQQCSLDGAAYQACASPRVLMGLADGAHEFRIRALDGAGNISNLITHNWTINTVLTLAVDIPLSGASASSSYLVTGNTPDQAIDDDPHTAWGAGAFAPAWLQLDLGRAVNLHHIELLVTQVPDGPTVHEIYGGPTAASMTLLGTLSGNTVNKQRLRLDAAVAGVRFLRILTTSSPSWVAWSEVLVFETKTSSQVNWPKSFSYWGSQKYADFGDHVNLVWTADYTIATAEAVAAGQKNIMLNTELIFFCHGAEVDAGICTSNLDQTSYIADGVQDPGVLPRSDYATRWNDLVARIGANMQYVKAIYLVDEPGRLLVNELSPAQQAIRWNAYKDHISNNVIPFLRSVAPGRKIMINYTGLEIDLPVSHLPGGYVFSVPAGLDWVAFDCYGPFRHPDGRNNDIPHYVDVLAAAMAPNQEMFLINDASGYLKTGTIDEVDEELKARAELYYSLALRDARIKGLAPFYYNDFQPYFGGIEIYPKTKARYREMGKSIISQ